MVADAGGGDQSGITPSDIAGTEAKPMSRSVVIIGAGVGGIYTAALLARQGYQVTVLEKNTQPGGRCNQLKHDGFVFDTGPTIMMMPDIYAQAFANLGEDIHDHLKLTRVEPSTQIFFGDGSQLVLTQDQTRMQTQLEAFEVGSYQAFQRYLEVGQRFYDLAIPHLINRGFSHAWEFFTPRNLYLAWQLKLFTRHYGYIRKYFQHPRLREAFTYQDTYLGLNPFDAAAMFSMLPALEFGSGVWYAQGGMYSVVKALVQIAQRFGAQFQYDSVVSKINTKKTHVTGITLANEQVIPADLVVANADLTHVYRELLGDEAMTARLLRKNYTCTVITFFWGLDHRYTQLGTHNLFMSSEYEKSFNQVMRDLTIPDDPSFYVHTPVALDPQRAPSGYDTLTAIVPVGHMDPDKPQDWIAQRDTARKIVLGRLAQVGLTDFEDHIVYEQVFTAEDWLSKFNLTGGSTLGLGHNLSQMAYFRPKNTHKRFQNLFFVGSNTHPGSGVPTVLISGRLTAERILRDHPKS